MAEEGEQKYPYSRCSSAGSLHTLTSSANNTDDEDSDLGAGGGGSNNSSGGNHLKDKRRVAHTQAEQKRRDSIKKGYDTLQEYLPQRSGSDHAHAKLSKATVLQKSIDYMQFLSSNMKKLDEELASYHKQEEALKILKNNYENIVAAHNRQQPGRPDKQVPEEVKFLVFRAVMDSLYQTFEPSVATSDFCNISASVISWLEEHCKPQILREIMCGVLTQLQQQEVAVRGEPSSFAGAPSYSPGTQFEQQILFGGGGGQPTTSYVQTSSSSVPTSDSSSSGGGSVNKMEVYY